MLPPLEFGQLRFDSNSKKNLERVLGRIYVKPFGSEVEEYESRWGKLFGFKYNVAVNSGTSADTVACKTLYDLGVERTGNARDNEIIAPALAFVAVGTSIADAGFTPVFADVDRETMNIDPSKIEEKITPRTRAIMAVHTMGKPCDMDSIMTIAKKHDLKVIEDCCEAHTAEYKGKRVGHFGDIAAYSSHVSHLISSMEGGMVSTNNSHIGEVAKSLRNHGRPVDSMYFNHERLGGNYKMCDLLAAVGQAECDRFIETDKIRRANLYYLMNKTEDLQSVAIMNRFNPHEFLAPHAFSVTIRDPSKYSPEELYKFLWNNSTMQTQAKRNFGCIPTQHKAFKYLGLREGDFPEAEFVGLNGVHFGVHQYLAQEQLDAASNLLHDFFSRPRK